MREIEIKIKVENLKEIEQKLIESDCKLSSPIKQHDVIYSLDNSTKEFISSKEGDMVIRLRQMDDETQLNLKKQCSSELDNIEYETVVKDTKIMHSILEQLGWHPIVEVKKIRKKGKFKEYEICLDEVEGLGSFIELEKMANDDSNLNEVREELFSEIELLGLSRNMEETRGYDTQIFLKNNLK